MMPSAISTLRPPEYSTPVVWKRTVAAGGHAQFMDGVRLADDSLIVGGSYLAKPEDTHSYRPLLARLGERGRADWVVRGEGKSVETIDRVIARGEGVVTLGGLERDDGDRAKQLTVALYDAAGKRTGGFSVSEPDGHLIPAAIVPTGDGYYIAARYENLKQADLRFGVVYKVDEAGKRLWRRAYVPGMVTSIDRMAVMANGDLILAGWLREEGGRQAGWAVRADRDGNIRWQKTFRRGRMAKLDKVVEGTDGLGSVVLGGTSWPADGGDRSGAWVIQLDINGNTQWERFVTGPYIAGIADLGTLPDGRIAAGITAIPANNQDADEIPQFRLLTFSKRGAIVSAVSFTDGTGLSVNRLVDAAGDPVLIGMMHLRDGEDNKAPAKFEGWAAELQPLKPYQDICE